LPAELQRLIAQMAAAARSQTWSTFVRNHVSAVLACDFCVAVTATFRVCYIFMVLDVGTPDPALECDRPSDG
jgi:hypothetical protein